MSGKWMPNNGDVAVISWRSPSNRHGGTALALRCSDSYDESHWRTQTFGVIADNHVTEVRPLLLIDPDDNEQIERLWTDYLSRDVSVEMRHCDGCGEDYDSHSESHVAHDADGRYATSTEPPC